MFEANYYDLIIISIFLQDVTKFTQFYLFSIALTSDYMIVMELEVLSDRIRSD
jgi:hypothetical protein